ncbi:LbetaH domain-containing protein [Streptomyces niveus]|uniref:hypothetical protein n=1 Tax=Streptomyces niveus TaxID=193462 RepID=UPI0036E52AA4
MSSCAPHGTSSWTSPLIEVGVFTYYDDPADPTTIENRNVLYHYGPEKLVGGNPARLPRRRYSDADIDRLLAVAWWDWPLPHLTEQLPTIMSGTVDALEAAAPGPTAYQRHRPH